MSTGETKQTYEAMVGAVTHPARGSRNPNDPEPHDAAKLSRKQRRADEAARALAARVKAKEQQP